MAEQAAEGRADCAQGVDAERVGQRAVVDGEVWATCRNLISSRRSSPWVRDSPRWSFGSRAYTAGSEPMRPSTWANLYYARTACIFVTTRESISHTNYWRRYNSGFAEPRTSESCRTWDGPR